MKYTIKVFGIARDIMGGRDVVVESQSKNVKELKSQLMTTYPALQKLNSLLIAVNEEYAEDDLLLSESDELALIPPVSGG